MKNTTKNTIKNARELRKNMTPEESRLWYCFLRYHPAKFRRQSTFTNYILDFYCHNAKLAIELDGSQHYETETIKYDIERTKELEKDGIMVLRFSNKDINERFKEVCEIIDKVVKERADRG